MVEPGRVSGQTTESADAEHHVAILSCETLLLATSGTGR